MGHRGQGKRTWSNAFGQGSGRFEKLLISQKLLKLLTDIEERARGWNTVATRGTQKSQVPS